MANMTLEDMHKITDIMGNYLLMLENTVFLEADSRKLFKVTGFSINYNEFPSFVFVERDSGEEFTSQINASVVCPQTLLDFFADEEGIFPLKDEFYYGSSEEEEEEDEPSDHSLEEFQAIMTYLLNKVGK